MAKEGMRFTDFSTSSSICTPSRAGLLTGRYARRWGHNNKVFHPDSQQGMPAAEITIAELLKTAKYQTALVGKWHLGHLPEFLPTNQGFDRYFGIPYSNDMCQAPETPLAANVVFNKGFTREQYLDRQDTKKKQLFNLAEDKQESKNLIRKYPEKAKELSQRLKEINAQNKP